jgi:hypothetical protein
VKLHNSSSSHVASLWFSVVLLIVTFGLPLAAQAQVSLFAYTGGPDIPVNGSFDYGSIAQGDTKDVVFRIRNSSASPVNVTRLALSGVGFAIVNSSSTPFTVASGSTREFTVRAQDPGGTCCSATLQVLSSAATFAIQLTASFVPAATLSVASPCTGPDSQATISFGRIQQGGQISCTFTLLNPNTQALTVSPISLTGAAFSSTQASSATIPAGQSIPFSVTFTASASNTLTGTFTVGARTFSLSGTGFTAPLPVPVITFDSTLILSGEQHTLTAKLPQASAVNASGTLALTFAPAGTVVADDALVQFVSVAKRVVSFTIAQGSADLLFNGQKNLIFSTGTTAGRITLTFDSPAYGFSGTAATTITVAPAPVSITSASVTRRVSDLDVVIQGFDNTYSMGVMSFTFYDANGTVISAPISADFTPAFTSFYKSQTTPPGSSFLMRVTFPVTGDATLVRSADVNLSNSAGSVTTQKLNFP